MGRALNIPLSTVSKDQEVAVTIRYTTTGECTALQWLDKLLVESSVVSLIN